MTRHLAALVLALGLVLTGCSGGGGSDEPEVDPRARYVEAAGAVCRDADADIAALTQPTTPDTFGPYVAQTVAIAEQAQRDLAALTPPPEDRDEIQRKVLTPLAALVEQGRAWSAQVTAAGADEAKLLPLLGSRPTSAGIDKQFLQSYGLEECADAVSKVG